VTDLPLNFPPAFDDEAFRLIGQIIAAWSDIHEHVHGDIDCIRTLIYVQQARKWRADNNGASHFGHVNRPHDIPDSRFKLKWRYYCRLVRALNHGQNEAGRSLDELGREVWRLYEVRNNLAHSRVAISLCWDAPSITLSSRGWMDDWYRKLKEKPLEVGRPRVAIVMSEQGLRQALGDMQGLLQQLKMLPRPFDETTPPTQPRPPK
jgi:hypothetical protein